VRASIDWQMWATVQVVTATGLVCRVFHSWKMLGIEETGRRGGAEVVGTHEHRQVLDALGAGGQRLAVEVRHLGAGLGVVEHLRTDPGVGRQDSPVLRVDGRIAAGGPGVLRGVDEHMEQVQVEGPGDGVAGRCHGRWQGHA